jgi:aryl-phospho-beta-D-glucosidase BglC (GH1 family)
VGKREPRTNGDLIVDGTGKTVTLHGFGLGAWHLLEGYLIGNPGGCPATDQYGVSRSDNPLCRTDRYIRKAIIDKVGAANAQTFFDAFEANFFNEAEMAQIQKWGFNFFRLPINANRLLDENAGGPPYTYIQRGFKQLDDIAAWAQKYKMYVMIDMHAAPGAQINHNIADAIFEYDATYGHLCGKRRLWDDPTTFWPRTIDLWLTIAKRYASNPYIMGYEFLNEPMMPGVEPPCQGESNRATAIADWTKHNNAPLLDLYKQITKALRDAGDKKIMVAEAAYWGMNFNGMQTPWDTNMVYAFHYYPAPTTAGFFGPGGNAGSSFQPVISQNIPIMCSETDNGGSAFVNFMKTSNSGNPMSWAVWTHKPGMLWNCTRPTSYSNLCSNWNATSAADAQTALMEYAASLATNKCTVNTGTITGLGGTP